LQSPRGAHIARRMQNYEPEWLLFAGNGIWGVIWGVVFLVLAGFALWRDRRRSKRSHAEQIGCMPWTTISILLIFAAAASFLFAMKS
jgi:MYXO-CTERM domain-containing protein